MPFMMRTPTAVAASPTMPKTIARIRPDVLVRDRPYRSYGPVLCVTAFDTEDEAVELANNSDYGLAAGI
jgi:hypothetical protein